MLQPRGWKPCLPGKPPCFALRLSAEWTRPPREESVGHRGPLTHVVLGSAPCSYLERSPHCGATRLRMCPWVTGCEPRPPLPELGRAALDTRARVPCRARGLRPAASPHVLPLGTRRPFIIKAQLLGCTGRSDRDCLSEARGTAFSEALRSLSEPPSTLCPCPGNRRGACRVAWQWLQEAPRKAP